MQTPDEWVSVENPSLICILGFSSRNSLCLILGHHPDPVSVPAPNHWAPALLWSTSSRDQNPKLNVSVEDINQCRLLPSPPCRLLRVPPIAKVLSINHLSLSQVCCLLRASDAESSDAASCQDCDSWLS